MTSLNYFNRITILNKTSRKRQPPLMGGHLRDVPAHAACACARCHGARSIGTTTARRECRRTVVVGHGPQSMMGLSIDSNSVAMNLCTVRISKSKRNSTTRAGNNKDGSFADSCGLIILCLHLNI